MRFSITLEALLSEIDLDGLVFTNDAPGSDRYDQLRELSPAELSARVPGLVARWSESGLLSLDGAPATLEIEALDIPEVGNLELLRISNLVLSASGAGDAMISWPKGAGELVIRQQGVDNPYTGLILGGGQSPALDLTGDAAMSSWEGFVSYIPVGFDHIVPKGLDHILFVLGLFFFSTALRPLLWQVTAFTAAHTVTLALGALGLVSIPGEIVEPLIAASIVYVAVENIFMRNMGAWRPAVIFGFGLLHGLGFASVLGDYGLPDAQFVPALLGFNVGVEVGQLFVIAIAALLIWASVQAARKASLPAHEAAAEDSAVLFRAVSLVGSLIIALIGVYWVIERVFL